MLVIVAVSLLLLAYTYVGYPLLIMLLARFFPRLLHPVPGWQPTVSVLIPVYNGEVFIRNKLDSLLAQDYPAGKVEILFASDGSTDATNEMLRQCQDTHPDRVRVFCGEVRSGKPAVLNRLRREARGELLLMTDIRQPLEPDCLSRLVAGLGDEKVGIAGGQLRLRGETGAGLYWKYENAIRLCESAFRSVTGVSGSLYLIAAKDMEDLPEDIILDDVWVPSLQLLQGRRVVLVSEAVAWDQAMDDEREFGRKVRTLAGNYQLIARLPALLSPLRNPVWFEFISHKVLRLLCPWALLLLLPGSILLAMDGQQEGWLRQGAGLMVIGQIMFYLLALAGERLGRGGRLARTFVVLNVAAVMGLWRHLRGRQKVAW